MYRSIILPAAKADLKGSSIWYEVKQKGLGKKFLFLIRETIHIIVAIFHTSRNPLDWKV